MKLKRKDKRYETVLTAPMLSSESGIPPLDPSHLALLTAFHEIALKLYRPTISVRKKCINSVNEKDSKSPKFNRLNINSSKSKRGH